MPQHSKQYSTLTPSLQSPDSDSQQSSIYQIYHSAEETGNWDAVAEYELSLLLKAVAATPDDKSKSTAKS